MGFLSNKIWVRIFLGHPVQGFTNNVVVFTHELVRCATHERFRKLNIQNADFDSENFILQEWNHHFSNQHPRKHGIQKKSPVYLKGEAVQSRNHSSVTIKFKFDKNWNVCHSVTAWPILFKFFCWLLFLKFIEMSPLSSYFMRVVNKGVQLSMEWPLWKTFWRRFCLNLGESDRL